MSTREAIREHLDHERQLRELKRLSEAAAVASFDGDREERDRLRAERSKIERSMKSSTQTKRNERTA